MLAGKYIPPKRGIMITTFVSQMFEGIGSMFVFTDMYIIDMVEP